MTNPPRTFLRTSQEVDEAKVKGLAIVALESTIFSKLGLPSPANAEALQRCLAAVRAAGAVPALTAVLDGVARVGVEEADHGRVLASDHKIAERDLAVAAGQGWQSGVTTVSASVVLAALAGIRVFTTGGIGGVHRGSELSGDVSADLDAIARHRVVTVSAGAKAFLDLARTLEYLETAGVPVLGFATDVFPAFYTRDSGCRVPHRVEHAAEIAAISEAHWAFGGGGLLVANPIPQAAELESAEVNAALERALGDAAAAGICGAALTPFVLDRISAVTEGRSVPANLALAESNASLAAQIAVALNANSG